MLAEKSQELDTYLISSFGVIRPCSTFVETDEKRIMRMVDAAQLITEWLTGGLSIAAVLRSLTKPISRASLIQAVLYAAG